MTKVINSFQRSALPPLTPVLRGVGNLWETLPFNNSPFLTAYEILILLKSCFPIGVCMAYVQKCIFTTSPEGAPRAAVPPPRTAWRLKTHVKMHMDSRMPTESATDPPRRHPRHQSRGQDGHNASQMEPRRRRKRAWKLA